MALRLEVISEHKDLLGDDASRVFGDDGGTIGRSLQNDWILPDPDKYVSGQHATIDCRAGAYYLADVSTNGVYINGSNEPLGKGNPRRLFDGDAVRMGDFEMQVILDEGEDLELPDNLDAAGTADYSDQKVAEDLQRSSMLLLDEEAITGDEEFQAALFGVAAPTDEAAAQSVDRLFDQSAGGDSANGFDGAAELFDDPRSAAQTADLFTVFLSATGIKRSDIHPSIDPAEVMTNAGLLLRELIRGMNELLSSRANVKSMFRLDQTTVMPRHNNPLKLTESTTDSIKQLLIGQDGEYLGPLDSVREVSRDLKFHHDAVVGGMMKAFGEFIDRFDPDELQDSFDKTLDRKPLLEKLNKVKYWQLYCDLYPIITQKGTATLPQQLAEEFVREYEKSITEFKRHERGLNDTQKIDPPTSRPADGVDFEPLEVDDGSFETTDVIDDRPGQEAQA